MNVAGFALSIAVHAATYYALSRVNTDVVIDKLDTVEMTVVEEPPPPAVQAPSEPEPEPAPAPPEPVVVKPPPKPVERAPRPAKVPPPPEDKTPPAAAEETIADFSGTTLTGQGGWASAVGNGEAMNAPIGAPGAAVTGRNRAGVAGGVIGGEGTRVVAAGDLSRSPQPPSAEILNAALERSYPKAAHQQGVEGVARIRLRVLASGKLQALATLSETYPGFAEACKASLKNMTFSPGLDKAGQAVATDINYKCDFTVE